MQEPKDTFDVVVNALIAERASPRKKSTKKTSRRSLKKRKGYAKPTKPQPDTREEFEIKIDSLFDDNATNADVRLREYMRGERSFVDRHGVETEFNPTEGRQYTLEEIGTIMGVTRERVRQIEENALRKMWRYIRSLNMREDLTETDWLMVLKQNDDKDRTQYFPGTI